MKSIRILIVFQLFGLLTLSSCDSNSGTTDAEIIVEDVSIGDGDEVLPGHTIIVDYIGRLEDGTIFDSSEIQEESLIFTLGVNNVIAGLDQGIPGMKVGGVRRIEIPPSLAFGRNGMCTTEGDCPVPANATVIFDITIVDILDYVIKEEVVIGAGEETLIGSLVEMGYVGVLQDGRIIASSDASGTLTFTVGTGAVIDGIEDGIIGMKPGGVRLLTIPPILGYGRYGDLTGTIPPYALLKYRIEVLRIL